MRLSLVSRGDAAKRLAQFTSGAPDSLETLSDLVRAEVHARTHAPRASTIARVIRLLAPVVDVADDRVAEVCDALERAGDLVLAPGGVLYATPLRAVTVKNRTRMFGSLPTRALAVALKQDVEAHGAARILSHGERLAEALQPLGGAVVAPEAWAGLDRAPHADAGFISRLDHRLEWEPLAGGTLERDGALEWRAWDLSSVPPRWRRSSDGRLWWAHTRFGGHHRVWTAGASPATSVFVVLSPDDADRARFALMRGTEGRAKATVQRSAGAVLVDVPAWLPRPEYRWLSLYAEPEAELQGARWKIAADDEARITELLAERLGLVVEVR